MRSKTVATLLAALALGAGGCRHPESVTLLSATSAGRDEAIAHYCLAKAPSVVAPGTPDGKEVWVSSQGPPLPAEGFDPRAGVAPEGKTRVYRVEHFLYVTELARPTASPTGTEPPQPPNGRGPAPVPPPAPPQPPKTPPAPVGPTLPMPPSTAVPRPMMPPAVPEPMPAPDEVKGKRPAPNADQGTGIQPVDVRQPELPIPPAPLRPVTLPPTVPISAPATDNPTLPVPPPDAAPDTRPALPPLSFTGEATEGDATGANQQRPSPSPSAPRLFHWSR